MSPERTQTLLRFSGDWPALPVFAVALGLAVAMFFFYRRELRYHHGMARWLPAALRSLAVFILVLCLAGPVLRQETMIRQLGRVIILADASASMSYTDELLEKGSQPVAAETRFARMEQGLLASAKPLVKELAKKHDVELFALRGSKAERLWWWRGEGKDTSGDLPTNFAFKPEATITNLDQPLSDALGSNPVNAAVVVLTDGQHNAAGSPEFLAQNLKEKGIPIFTVGYGSEAPPADLALVKVIAPEAVFAEDRAEGQLLVQDTLPAGLTAVASISHQNKVLWQQTFTTNSSGERRFEFSFPVKDIPAASDAAQPLRLLNVRVELSGGHASKDRIVQNNSRVTSLHLLTRKRKVLLLDGRARWETRYLHNHFDRDERWQVAAAFDDFSDGLSNTFQATFPKTKEELMTFDLIILGDVRSNALSLAQQEMIVEFVEKRGGGLILVDGHRGHLKSWEKTPAAALLPVSWKGQKDAATSMAFDLTLAGQNLEALRLSDSASTNSALWKKLPEAFWCASAEAQPDATVLVNLSANESTPQPAIVWRRFGAGSVLWMGTDEFWRWRYEVADLHHQRFWMQMAAWVGAPPFLVENDRISMGTDHLRYQEGDTAELRVRLRDEKGSVRSEGKPRAHVFHNGLEIASLELEPDPAHGGVFRAITSGLPGGDYQVSISENNAPKSDLKLGFRVESQANQEWSQLSMNRPLLESMSRTSGGRFLREGDISQLPDLLQQLDRQETRVKETLLWSSWWWFGAVIALLTLEWLLRKRWRLV